MEQQNGNSQPDTSKTLLSEEDELLHLRQMILQRANLLTGTETNAEINAKYEAYQVEQTHRVEAERAKREREIKEAAHKALMEGMRTTLQSYGIDPTGMDEAQMREAGKRARDKIQANRDLEKRRANAVNLFNKAGCPTRHVIHLNDDDHSQDGEWKRLRELLTTQAGYANGYLVALLGKRGGGKTQLAVAVIHDCCVKQMTCRYIKAMDLFRDMRRAYTPVGRGERGESEDGIIEKWVGYDLLVIDEAHQRGDTEWEFNSLVNLLDRRYDERKCTILIANEPKAEFASKMGESVVSRIHETGEAIECNWETRRKPGAWRQGEGAETRVPSGKLWEERRTFCV